LKKATDIRRYFNIWRKRWRKHRAELMDGRVAMKKMIMIMDKRVLKSFYREKRQILISKS
jgi:hypothetical protein